MNQRTELDIHPRPGLDRPRNSSEQQLLRRLDALDLQPVGICPECRSAIILGSTEQTVDDALAYHRSAAGGCDARIAARLVAAHVRAGRPAAAVATMRYPHLKVKADDATGPERHRLRDRITSGIPAFEQTTWALVYDLFGSPYETEAESE